MLSSSEIEYFVTLMQNKIGERLTQMETHYTSAITDLRNRIIKLEQELDKPIKVKLIAERE